MGELTMASSNTIVSLKRDDDDEDSGIAALGSRKVSAQEKFQNIAHGRNVSREDWIRAHGSDAGFSEADVDHSGEIDADEFFASEVEVANCNNGPIGYWR